MSRIIHTCLRYPPSFGGAESYIQNIVEQTRDIDEGRDVRVLTSKLKTHVPAVELEPEQLLDDQVYIQRLHHMTTPFLPYPRLQALPYYIGHHKPDILHSYAYWYQPADVTARYAKRHNIPFIFHPLYYPRDKKIWELYTRFVGTKTFEAADVIVCISPYEQSLIEKDGLPVKRFEIIPPGIDTDEFSRDRLNPFIKRKINGTILLTASRLSIGKKLHDVIRALPDIVTLIPDAQLVLVGEDFGEQAALTAQAQEYGVANRVHFIGKVSREELIGAYQHCNVFIHPSEYEAFGIVIAEAAMAGAPVVARNATAIPFATPPVYHPYLFTTHQELVRHVHQAAEKPEVARKADAEKAKEYVRETFGQDIVREKILGLYNSLRKPV